MEHSERRYECIVFGATGYTGKYTAEHIATHLPSDFKWAVAGRSEGKLRSLGDELKSLNPDRIQPGIEIAQLEKADLVSLAQKTKVLITTVGPYHQYGEAVIAACAETGTHYLDTTGEVVWVHDMIAKYHEVAKKNGSIMICQNGIESAPPDLMCWELVSQIRETLDTGTNEVIHTTYDMKATASGGTLASLIGIFDNYSLSDLSKTQDPWCLCPVPAPTQSNSTPLTEKITGVRTVDGLGTLTDSIQGAADVPIIHRSWGLFNEGKLFGPNFHMTAYSHTQNFLKGFAFHVALNIGLVALVLPPTRWLLKQFVSAPGEGPTREQAKSEYVEWRTIANADATGAHASKHAYGRMRWNGSMYHLTGACLAEAALVIAREKTFAHELGGGILTPATLGDKYLGRLQTAGLEMEFRIMP